MAGFALDILDFFHVGMNVAISHGFCAGMAVNAVQRVFAFCKLRNRLIIIIQAVNGLVGACDKGHRTQVIISAVMAGIALRIRDRRRQIMDLSLRK